MPHTPTYLLKPGKYERRVRLQKSAKHHDRKYRESARRLGLYGQSSNPNPQERPMYGTPNAAYPTPRAPLATPPMILHFGRPWLSSVGLADLLDQPHSAVFDRLLELTVSSDFWDMHFADLGGRAIPTVIWMDADGFRAVAAGLTGRGGWRDVIEAGFAALTPTPPPPEPCGSWWHRLARWAFGGLA